MKVCIIGDSLISLTLARALANEEIHVDIFSSQKIGKIDKSRTLGISKANIDFYNKYILNIKRFIWDINKIEIFTDNLKKEKILNFDNNQKELFSIVKNHELYNYLNSSLSKSKYIKKKKKFKDIITKKYKLIINCDSNNLLSKKYFRRQLKKIYNSHAFTTIIEHKKTYNNKTAVQIFTKNGPLAFLPISENKTSVVYSARGSKKIDINNLIKDYNTKYEIIKIHKAACYELKATNLRNYYYENILAFGDMLHRIHPLAGQGYNMSIRDIKLLLKIIKFKINHGLDLDKSVCKEFEKNIRHKNYLFSNGIDFVYELFKFESKLANPILSKSLQAVGKNKLVNNFFTKIADNGIVV